METEITIEQIYPMREGPLWRSPDFEPCPKCILCFTSVPHDAEQHLMLSKGIEV